MEEETETGAWLGRRAVMMPRAWEVPSREVAAERRPRRHTYTGCLGEAVGFLLRAIPWGCVRRP